MKRLEFKKMFELENTHFWFLGKRLCIDAILSKRSRPSKTRILDIGCGTGGTTLFLRRYGTVVGLEKDPYAYTFSKNRGLSVKMGSASNLPFQDGSFDMVTLLDILYHQDILDVAKVVKEARRVLVNHGELLITDSALPFLWSKHDVVMHGRRRFTVPELEQVLRSNGFVIKKSSYYFFLLFPLLIIKRKIVDLLDKDYQADVQKLPGWINMCGFFLMKIESLLLKYVRLPFGSSLIVYAEKGS